MALGFLPSIVFNTIPLLYCLSSSLSFIVIEIMHLQEKQESFLCSVSSVRDKKVIPERERDREGETTCPRSEKKTAAKN